jgi:competence protein ComEC
MSKKDMLLYSSSFGFAAGVFLAREVSAIYLAVGILCCFALVAFFFFERSIVSTLLLGCIFITAVIFGVVRLYVALPQPSVLTSRLDQEILFEGVVADDPDIRAFNTKLTVQNETDTVLATVPLSTYTYGDRVRLRGVLEKPENFETDTLRTFDYVSYLGKDNIFFIMPKAQITVVSQGEGSRILSTLFSLKHQILKVFEKIFPEPERSLIGGILIGTKQSLNKETHDDLVVTGTIHIVALSGYNVSVVAAFFMYLLSSVASKVVAITGGALGIILFVLMTGATSTAVRAGIMALLALLAKFWGRPADGFRLLVITGIIMLIVNPRFLTDDISFQLSFLATAGIILIEPRIRNYFVFLRFTTLISGISVTLAAQLAVLPYLVYKMGTLSVISLPVNVLILPMVEIVMLLGGATAFLGLLFFPLAIPIGYAAYLLLHLILSIIRVAASVPFAAIIVPEFSWVVVLCVYGLIWYYVVYKGEKLT